MARSGKKPTNKNGAAVADASGGAKAAGGTTGSAGEPAPGPASRTRRPRPERPVRARPESLRLRSMSASLTVSDIERALVFYGKGLGFYVAQRWETDGKLEGLTLRAGVCELNLAQDDWAKGRERKRGEGVRLWLETVQDLDAIAERAESFGAVITEWPADRSWGVRSFSLDDPDGYHLSFFHRLEG